MQNVKQLKFLENLEKRYWNDFLYSLAVLVVYAVVSFQHIGIIARQNTCILIYGCTIFHECVNGIFPKSDLAH